MINDIKWLFYDELKTKIGDMVIVVDDIGVRAIHLIDSTWQTYKTKNLNLKRDSEKCNYVTIQLKEYFEGKRKKFDLPLSITGSEFRKKVWTELKNIPYGETRSYSDIAKAIGNKNASIAIGQANKANPIPIIIPCHRVISKKGSLIGYIGDNISIQELLLRHEGAMK